MNHNEHGKKHGILMILCCLIPLLLILAIPRFGIELGPLTRLAPFAMILICPLMHIGMMFFMFKGKKGDCHQENPQSK
ncbi:DUF2933 domain-containing protein [Alkaliphilus peptidifermentans]|uniref:DUF2933 domain-containing protein n=1 Tax=Alkaliphilus peptidifermentans DSM 18978 TaxID=1120976 RepID=A0A1G5DQI2_9FIRM|nr:DUF2933 domain-containing protein [Alkaliphilus peptidifermentans]SCY16976.1 hypothetical protein SAMN03080606_00982 [Alkaliphilus peptidifermentans DSM 18978]